MDTCVANLIDDSVGWWNTRIIDDHFSPFEAQTIKSIPLCISPQPDYLHWPLERNGNYSVKSGYKLLCEESSRDEASSSNPVAATSFWSSIWKLKVLGKVKYFLWRACTNSLPTKANLMKRKNVADSTCHRCRRQPEDIMLALWGCEAVKHVWCYDFRWINDFEASQGTFFDLVGRILQKPRVLEIFANTAWFIWTHRNKTSLN